MTGLQYPLAAVFLLELVCWLLPHDSHPLRAWTPRQKVPVSHMSPQNTWSLQGACKALHGFLAFYHFGFLGGSSCRTPQLASQEKI